MIRVAFPLAFLLLSLQTFGHAQSQSATLANPSGGSGSSADASAARDGEELLIGVDKLHIGNGDILAPAVIFIAKDGSISGVMEGPVPPEALHVEGAEMTPGLVDAYSYMGVGAASNEETTETTPAMRLADTVDLSHPSFQNALAEGVTTAYLTPDTANVIGGLGCLVKTSGGQSTDLFAERADAAQILDADGALKISLGNDPTFGNYSPWNQTSVFERRPTTRMGTVWIIRREFYRALRYARLREAGAIEANPDYEVLLEVIRGERPVRVLARRNHDIQTAIRLQKEFGWKNLMIEEAIEAYRIPHLIVAANIPVISGPLYDDVSRSVAQGFSLAEWRSYTNPPTICCEDIHEHMEEGHDFDFEKETGVVELSDFAKDLLVAMAPRYDCDLATGPYMGRVQEDDWGNPAWAKFLADAGVTCVLGAAEAHDGALSEASLIHQARTAVHFGLDPNQALRMVTLTAAELCGAEDRVGSVQAGKDADLVLWSGPPLRAESRPLLVLAEGQIVLDRR